MSISPVYEGLDGTTVVSRRARECKWHNDECLSQKVAEQLTFDFTKQVATATGGGIRGAKMIPNEQVYNPNKFLVLIKGGAKAKYQERRKNWRNSNCPKYYKKHNLNYRFMLTMPAHETIDPNEHDQSRRASDREILDMEKLQNESIVHQDMAFLSLKDVYSEFSFKTMRMFEWAVA